MPKISAALGATNAADEHVAIVTYWRSFAEHERSHADAVFKAKFGQYVQKHGSPEAASRAWFTGAVVEDDPRPDGRPDQPLERHRQVQQLGDRPQLRGRLRPDRKSVV